MSSREEMFAALQAQAQDLGWQIVEPYDGEGQVEMMLTAPGACEQVISGTMLQARKQLNELERPEEYPAVEEYDLDDRMETVQAVAEAEDITADEAANQLAYEENDPEWAELLAEEAAAGEQGRTEDAADVEEAETSPTMEEALDAASVEARDAAGEAEAALTAAIEGCTRKRDTWEVRLERAKDALRNVVEDGNGHVGVDGLHEDISPFGPTMKELWRGEIARPNQYLPEVYDMGDRRIIARKSDEVRVFGGTIEGDVKAGLEDSGFSFFSVTKKRANAIVRGELKAQRTGRVVTTTVNGREVAPEGYRIRVAGNGLPVQFFKSVNESAWEGFELSLVEAGA